MNQLIEEQREMNRFIIERSVVRVQRNGHLWVSRQSKMQRPRADNGGLIAHYLVDMSNWDDNNNEQKKKKDIRRIKRKELVDGMLH